MYGYGNSMFLATHGILARSASGAPVDPDAQAFITAAAITNPTQQAAINTLVVNLKGYSIWTKFKAIYPIVGGTAAQHKWNLKDPRDLDVAFRLNYAIGITHSANGMISNGSSGYADTFLQPATHLLNNSCHISYYSRTNQSDNNWDCGAADDANSYLAMNIRTAAGAFRPFAQDISINTFSNSNSTGFYVANRTASNVKNGWKNGSKVITSAAVSSNRTNIKVFLLALNSGTPTSYSTRQCAFASIGDGLTDTEAANFYTAVQAYQTTLSRNV